MIDYYKLKVFESSKISQTVLSLLHNPIGLELNEEDSINSIHSKIMEAREKLEILRMHESDPQSASDYQQLEKLLYDMLDIFATEQDKLVYDTTLQLKYEQLKKETENQSTDDIQDFSFEEETPTESFVDIKRVASTPSSQEKDKKIIRDALFLGISFIAILSICLIFNLSVPVLSIVLSVIVILTLLLP